MRGINNEKNYRLHFNYIAVYTCNSTCPKCRLQVSDRGDIIIDSHETIKGDVVTVLGDITVDGKVSGDVVAILGNVRVNGEVTGDVTSVGGTIIRGETSKIYGKSTEIGVSGIKGLVNGIKRPGIHLDPGIFARNISTVFLKSSASGAFGRGDPRYNSLPECCQKCVEFG